MKIRWRLILVALVSLAFWIAADVAYVLSGQPYGIAGSAGYFMLPALAAAFAWAVWPAFPRQPEPLRSLLRVLTTLGVVFVWLLPALYWVTQVHIAVGGRL